MLRLDNFWACSKAGGPTEAGSAAFLGRGLLRIRSRRLGGRAVGGRGSGRLYRASQGDEGDVHCAQYFVNSSLAPVVLFRRRLKSVADVLKGTRDKGFYLVQVGCSSRFLGSCMSSWSLVPSLPMVLGIWGFSMIGMVSTSGFLVPLSC